MSIFKELVLFSNFLETEEDYTIWILGLYKLCKNNIKENPELQLLYDVVTSAMTAKQKTGSYINYFSKTLAAEMQKIPLKELVQ